MADEKKEAERLGGRAETEATGDSQALCARMNAASKKLHGLSDALVNARLVVLFTDRKLYGRALHVFYLVFLALEESLEAAIAASKEVASLAHHLRPLYRASDFERDLQYFLGADWRKHVDAHALPSALHEYTAHLRSLAGLPQADGPSPPPAPQPVLLLAHAYTQHLAVATGGQIIRRAARKSMALPEDSGTAAFDFPVGVNPRQLRNELKAALDALGDHLPQDVQHMIIEEHVGAFRYNNRILRGFKLGAWNVARGLVVGIAQVTPTLTWLSLLLLLLALLARWWMSSRKGV